MVIKQEAVEKIIEILQGWSDPQMTMEQLLAKSAEVRELLGFDPSVQSLTKEQSDLISHALIEAIFIHTGRISNAN